MSSDEVMRIKEKIDIVALIGERVNLKKAGRNFKGLCPFHGEKSPSFFVSPEMQMYKCFGCQEAGDVIAFLERYEGWSFREVLEALAKRAGVTLTPFRKTGDEDKRERLMEMLHLAAEYYHYLLIEHTVGVKAREYLKQRGIHNQSIADFKLGYALESWDGLQRYLVGKKGYKVEELEEGGLVIKRQATSYKSQAESGYYDRFRGRIMFPLKDFAGHLVGFSGRVLEAEADEAKYINSPETRLYHKSECLFGLSQAKQAVRKADRVLVVEGEMDVIMSHQAEVKEAVAVKGSALTEAQVLHLRKLTKQIVLCMDADAAGQEAMLRAIEVAEKQGMNLTAIRIAEGKDPAEIAFHNPKRWREVSRSDMPIYHFLMEWAFERFDGTTGTGQKEISRFLAPLWVKIENAVERTYYMKKLAERLQVSIEVIEDEMAKITRFTPQVAKDEDPLKQDMDRREKLERYVVALTLQAELAEAAWARVQARWFKQTYLKRLVETVKSWIATHLGTTSQQVIRALPAELQQLVQELYGSDLSLWRMSESDLEQAQKRGLKDLERLAIRDELSLALAQLGEEDTDVAAKAKWQAHYRQLSVKLKQLELGDQK